MPDLTFEVLSAEVQEYAATPTILFRLAVENSTEEEIHSVTLRTQLRIAATQRPYNATEQEKLLELFGWPHQWKNSLRSLLWTNINTVIPRFSGSTIFELPVTCTYDLDVVGTKYFNALDGGEVPLEFMFSGTVFYRGETGHLQVVQIPWDREAHFRMPVRLWKDMIDHYFPNSAWLRIRRDIFDRLYDYRSRKGLLTWENTLDSLLQESEEGVES